METILQHIFEQLVQCSLRACLGENTKHGSVNHTETNQTVQKQQT